MQPTMKRTGSVDKGLEKFAGAMRSGFDNFARMVSGGDNAPLSGGQFAKLSSFIRCLDPADFGSVLEILDKYGAPYFPPSAPVEMLKELPVPCARELLALAETGIVDSRTKVSDPDAKDSDSSDPEAKAVAARSAKVAKQPRSPLKSLLMPMRQQKIAQKDGGDLKASRQEVATLQRMLESKMRSISDLNQQLASTIVRAQNAEADLNLYKRRIDLLSTDYADMGKKLQKLDAEVNSLKLEKAELVTLLSAAETRATSAEEKADAREGALGVPRNLALDDLKQVIAVANAKVGYVLPASGDGEDVAKAAEKNTALIDQAQVDSLRYMHVWLMDAIRKQEELRRAKDTALLDVADLKERNEELVHQQALTEKQHSSEIFELSHLREESQHQALAIARLKQEVADREASYARMEAMHARLLETNRSYAADQIQFRDTMASEFDAVVAVKNEALATAQNAEEKAERAKAETAHHRAQAVALRENLKAAQALTKRVLEDGAKQLAESEAKFDAAQKQLQEFQAALQAEHADVVEKVRVYLTTAAKQRKKKLKKKGGSLVAGLDFDQEEEDSLVVQYYKLSKADLFVKYLLTRNEFKSLSDAHAEKTVKDAFEMIRRQFAYDSRHDHGSSFGSSTTDTKPQKDLNPFSSGHSHADERRDEPDIAEASLSGTSKGSPDFENDSIDSSLFSRSNYPDEPDDEGSLLSFDTSTSAASKRDQVGKALSLPPDSHDHTDYSVGETTGPGTPTHNDTHGDNNAADESPLNIADLEDPGDHYTGGNAHDSVISL